jgi:hypothetical protein
MRILDLLQILFLDLFTHDEELMVNFLCELVLIWLVFLANLVWTSCSSSSLLCDVSSTWGSPISTSRWLYCFWSDCCLVVQCFFWPSFKFRDLVLLGCSLTCLVVATTCVRSSTSFVFCPSFFTVIFQLKSDWLFLQTESFLQEAAIITPSCSSSILFSWLDSRSSFTFAY